MEITEINISLRNEDKLKAFVNVTFDDVFVVREKGRETLFPAIKDAITCISTENRRITVMREFGVI